MKYRWDIGVLLDMVSDEIKRSRLLYPDNRHMYVVLAEEVGEVARALLSKMATICCMSAFRLPPVPCD